MARPLKAVDPGAQVTIALRVPGALRARLEEEASKSDRNLSQESERRLRRSFDPVELAVDAVALVRDQKGLWPSSAKPLAQVLLWEIYGREAGDAGLDVADNLAWARQGARAVRGRDVLDRIDAAQRTLEAVKREIEARIRDDELAVAKPQRKS